MHNIPKPNNSSVSNSRPEEIYQKQIILYSKKKLLYKKNIIVINKKCKTTNKYNLNLLSITKIVILKIK